MRIARTDLSKPIDISFSGKFGEEPGVYSFTKGDDGKFACDFEDEIIIRRLLSIPGYVALGESGQQVSTPRPASPVLTAATNDPTTVTQARAHYQNVTGKRPSPKWDVAAIMAKLAAHNQGEPNVDPDDEDDEADDEGEGGAEGEEQSGPTPAAHDTAPGEPPAALAADAPAHTAE